MDISQLKDDLGDEKFSELEAHVNALISQRDEARNESISGRKGLKEKVQTLETERAQLFERLGIDSLDELADLPDAKGQADAVKQFEAKVKRLERDLADAQQAGQDAETRYRDSQRKIAVSAAMQQHKFVAPDLVESYINPRLQWEGDELFYKADGDKLVPVADGVAELAKARPELLQPTGAGGAGVGSRGAGGAEQVKEMSRADFEALPAEKKVELAKQGIQLH
jgi:hypothetical protein